MFLEKVISQFSKYNVPYALVGGHAVSLHGAVRGSVDLDFMVQWSLENLENVEKALQEIGLFPLLPISPKELFKFRDEYIEQQKITAWSFANPNDPSELVDIIISHKLNKASIKMIKLHNKHLYLLGKKSLIKMKRERALKQDLIDVAALERIDEL